MGKRSVDIALKERMSIPRGRGKFRVELTAYEPGMLGDLDDLHQMAIDRAAGNAQPSPLQ
jgi:hypothetical protein